MTVLSISVFFCALYSKYTGSLIYLPHFFKYYVCINIPDIWKLLISSYKFTSGKYATVKFSSYKAEHLYIVNSCTFLRLHDGEQQVTISSFMCTSPFSSTPLAPLLLMLLKYRVSFVHFNAKTCCAGKIKKSISEKCWIGRFVWLCT